MVATVGSISIDLSTNADKFATGFKSAATTVESQSARMAKSVAAVERNTALAAGTLKNFGAALAAGAGLAAIASLGGAFDKLKQTISEYDEIATNAKTTGLTPDTYQALAFAAKQANISQESYNSALNIFAKNAGLAATGQGALYSGLKKLNPELLQNILNTKDQEERLKLVADAMAQTSDATEKAALSAAVFGKGGVEISRILENGRASIDKFKQTAKDLGIIIPDDLLQKAGELDDKLDVLSSVINAQLGQALINLAPLLVKATTGFADFSKGLNSTSGALDTFVNNPSWANFNKLLETMGSAPIVKGSVLDVLANGKSEDTGFLAGLVDNYTKAFEEFGKIFTDTTTNTSDESTKAIAANIQYLNDLLANLKASADQSPQVQLEISDAEAKLKALQGELVETKAAGVSAANDISAAFAQAFREAENASMKALAAMQAGLAAAGTSNPLPNVTRYGGNPNQIELPTKSSSYNSNANGTGVGVRSFGGADANDKTADNTETTADNVSTLDHNTKGYLKSLSSDMAGYSAQQVQQSQIVVSKLSELPLGLNLATSLLAQLVHNNDSGATGTGKTMFGDSFDPQFGSYISSWGVGSVKRPGLQLASTADDGTSNTSISVAQPGNPLTFVYNAAAGVSNETAKQQAREMYDELTLQASRA